MDLSPRQRQALVLYLRLRSRKEAAARMGIALQTFKNHLGAAYAKLGVESAVEAAVAMGWLTLPEDEAPAA
jgi:DNA-binding CsgD family transcriptional regulator